MGFHAVFDGLRDPNEVSLVLICGIARFWRRGVELRHPVVALRHVRFNTEVAPWPFYPLGLAFDTMFETFSLICIMIFMDFT